MRNYKVSVIIISYNTAELLKRAVDSVEAHFNDFSYEIIVVDNASVDGSQELIENIYPHITLIKNTTNMGFAKANNQAIEIAKGELYLLLNSDVIITNSCFESLVRFIDEDKIVAAVGPKILNVDGTLQSKGYSFPSIVLEFAGLFRLPRLLTPSTLNRILPQCYWDSDTVRRVDWISGCCMLLRREVVDIVGGLCEDFFMYHEDEEWCHRAHRANHQIWYCPTTSVIHDNNGSPMEDRLSVAKKSTKIYFRMTIGIGVGVLIQSIGLLSNVLSMIWALIGFDKNKLLIITNKIKQQISFIAYLLSTTSE